MSDSISTQSLRAQIVMIHGSLADGRAWTSVAKHLSDGEFVQTPDLPGWGTAQPLPETAEKSTRAMAMAMDRLIKAQPGRILLVGHSYGGNVALHIALKNRKKISGILLFEPVFYRALELIRTTEILAESTTFFNSYFERVAAGNFEAISEVIEYLFGADLYSKFPERVQTFLVQAAEKNVVNVRASISEDLTMQQLAEFDCPAVVVHGGSSPRHLKAVSTALAQLLPQAELVVIPGANHGMLSSHAPEVARIIENMRTN